MCEYRPMCAWVDLTSACFLTWKFQNLIVTARVEDCQPMYEKTQGNGRQRGIKKNKNKKSSLLCRSRSWCLPVLYVFLCLCRSSSLHFSTFCRYLTLVPRSMAKCLANNSLSLYIFGRIH